MDNWLYTKITKTWMPSIQKDDDFVCVVDGAERSGKSVFAQQLAISLDPNFTHENICMTADAFKKAIDEAKKGTAIIYDEAFTGLSSKGTLSSINKIVVEQMMEMGQKCLKVIIVMPTFFYLEKYVALFRAECLFHIYKKRKKRGFWIYFGPKRKKSLFLTGKKLLSYKEPRSKRRGRFPNFYPVDEATYRDKKSKSFHGKGHNSGKQKFKYQRDVLFWLLVEELGIEHHAIERILETFGGSIDQALISKAIKAIREKVKDEIQDFPDDELLLSLIQTVNTRNRIQTDLKHKEKLKKQAESALRRQMKKIKAITDPNLLKMVKNLGDVPHLDSESSENNDISPK